MSYDEECIGLADATDDIGAGLGCSALVVAAALMLFSFCCTIFQTPEHQTDEMKMVFELTELLTDATILDGNGNPLDTDAREYYCRFLDNTSHRLLGCYVKSRVFKTLSGREYIRPVCNYDIVYPHTHGEGKVISGQFVALRIKEGVFAFPQLIPIGEEIALPYDKGRKEDFRKAILLRMDSEVSMQESSQNPKQSEERILYGR